jgi:hypothetical protein
MSNTPATPTTEIVLACFYANYQDAVHSVFYDGRDGGYQYAPGAGPCDPLEVLREQFPEADEHVIKEAVREIESEGGAWVNKRKY